MKTMVLPLGTLTTGEGPAFAILAMLPDGEFIVRISSSWAAAAAELSPHVQGVAHCDESLSLVGRRMGWKAVEPTEAQLLDRAAFALGFLLRLPRPKELSRFCRAWVAFFRMRLWQEAPAEMAIHVLKKKKGKTTTHAIEILGQAGIEFGFAFYEDPRAFDAVWNGETYPLNGLSVLAGDDPFLTQSFEPLGIRPPIVTRLVNTQPEAPQVEDFVLAAATMQLLTNMMHGDISPAKLTGGATLEFARDAP